MKNNSFVLAMVVVLGGFMPFSSYAVDTKAAEEDIKVTCREESKNAESAEIYYAECVADKLQALRENQSGNADVRPEKG